MDLNTTLATVIASQPRASASTHIITFAVLAACAALVLAAGAIVVSPRWRRTAPRVIVVLAGGLLAVYLVGRGIAEFWIVDYSNPASYQNLWGGPSLAGVLAVHSGPGLAIVIATPVWLRHRRRRKTAHAKPAQRNTIAGAGKS